MCFSLIISSDEEEMVSVTDISQEITVGRFECPLCPKCTNIIKANVTLACSFCRLKFHKDCFDGKITDAEVTKIKNNVPNYLLAMCINCKPNLISGELSVNAAATNKKI